MRIGNKSLNIVKSIVSIVTILLISLVISSHLSLVLQAKEGGEGGNGDTVVAATIPPSSSTPSQVELKSSPTVVTPPNNLTLMLDGCYYVSKISHEGAGGKLFFVSPIANSDILIASDYNKLGKNSSVLLGNFKTGDKLIFKINPFYSKSPKEIVSTDSKRVKQTTIGSNNYQLAFEDAIDNDFNDIVLKVYNEKCKEEEPPVIPPVDPTPTPPVTPPTPPVTPPTTPTLPVLPEPVGPVTPPTPAPTPDGGQGVSPTVPVTPPTSTPSTVNPPLIPTNTNPTNPNGANGTASVPLQPTPTLIAKNVTPTPMANGGQGPSATVANNASSTTNGRINPSPTAAAQTPTTAATTATPLAITGTALYNECSYPDFPWDNWCVQYYNTNPYTGIMTYSENYYTSPDFLGRKDFINKDWGNGGPGGVTNPNYFSAKFIKHQWFDGGFYKFYTQFDDGMKLVIDGRLIIDKWENPAWDFEARADISAGWHTVEVYYQEKTGGAKISLSWELGCKDGINTTSWCGEFYPNNYYGGIPFKPVQRLGDFWDDNWGNGNVTFELNNQRNLFSGSYVNQLNQLPTDNFTGYFTKLHYFPAATYTFITQADDNIQIFIDGENIISQLSCCNQTRVDKQLTAGNHLIQIRYKEFTGEAKLVFRWEYKDRNFPTGQIYSPSFNYQTISGSQFKVEATADDNIGTNNTGVAFVSFYAYYNNQLYFLGLENNDNIDNKYSALINLSNITSSQNIEFSIAVTDRAGNVTNVAGGSRWAWYPANFNVESSFSVNNGNNNYTNANLRIENPNVTGNATNLKASYSTSGQSKNVWIVSHGMNNSRGSVADLSQGIIQNTKDLNPNNNEDIVLTLDWSQGASSGTLNATDTDQWIEPTAIQVKKKLDQWGFTNRDKLYLIGHSMGTIMSAEISSQFGNQAKLLIALDPPNSKQTNSGSFTTNDVTVKKFNSFENRAQRTRSFVGRGSTGSSFCGNYAYSETAQESYQVYFPDIIENDPLSNACPVHYAVVRTITAMLKNRRIQSNLLAINDTIAGSNARANYLGGNANGILYTNGDSTLQFFAYLSNSRINLVGTANNDSVYWIQTYPPSFLNRIGSFTQPNERIGLIQTVGGVTNRYQITNYNNKPMIQVSQSPAGSTTFTPWINFTEVDGGRADVSTMSTGLSLAYNGSPQAIFQIK
jgi:pimeloyl-ACP methyl ester carboxylesterase